MTILERVMYIYNEARKAGITYHGAIGLIGNLKGETSDFDPMSLETLYCNRFGLTDAEYVRRADTGEKVYTNKTFVYDSAGFGIAQWTWWSRKKGLLDFAKSLGKSVGDLEVQVKYMFKEMQTNYTKTWKVLTTTNNYREAVKICVNDYEKPANAHQAIQTRSAYAAEFLTVIPDQKVEQEESPIVTPEAEKPTTTVSNFDRRKLVQMALSQVGYKEKRNDSQLDDFTANAGTNNYTKYARDLDQLSGFYNGKKQGFAWCDMFVDWCFVECFGVEDGLKLLCQKAGGAGAGCTYSMQYFQAKGQFIRRNDGRPEVGDQIFFGSSLSNSGHTGIVYAVDSNKVYTVEGNTTDSPSVVAEGTSVLKKSYNLTQSNIIGYGRPLWNDGYIGNGFEITMGENDGEEVSPEASVPTPTPEVDKIEIDAKMPTLRQGSYGEEVRKAQKALIAKGYSCGTYGADGSFGSATLSAVNRFRRDYGLSSNGIIDNEMWVLLLDLRETPKPETPQKDNVPPPTPSKTQFDRQILLNVALAEVGYYEKKSEAQLDDRTANAGQKNFNKYARDLDAISHYYYHDRKQGLNWCDIFCDWCFVAAYGVNDSFTINCQPQYSYGAGCPESMAYYKAQGRLSLIPQVGDQFFLSDGMGSTGHTGLVLEVNGDYITTIEGNQSIGYGTGIDGVVKKTRRTWEIAGFGHPKYNDGYGTDEYIGKKEEAPVIPEVPVIPEAPETPETPEVPVTPELPITPEIPEIENEGIIMDVLVPGSQGEQVKTLQILLEAKGYSVGTYGTDGDFGNDTGEALIDFKVDCGLPTIAVCDKETWEKILKG